MKSRPVPWWVRVYRLGFGILALYAVYAANHLDDDLGWLRFFTNQSGILSGVTLVLGALVFARRMPLAGWDTIRGTAVMSSIVTGVVYGLLVSSFYNPFNGDHTWHSSVLHQLIPLVMLLDVLIVPISRRVPGWSLLVWTVYPLAYLLWALWHGDQTGWYPYDFLDPGEYDNGLRGVLSTCAVIMVGFFIVAAIIWAIGRLRANQSLTDLRRA